ncbi:hypothetical protein CY0110_19892 [Crocosphaera chwakensis CCY0110]|uniref:Uncharacterized protein n=1 Tax=Crocosphaera chwakensis CCY0110 TaxID=391612 RepID=A3IJW0_9CHRO|nr:hypothetical protein CY0110_19892 [Crocosphaera chwakensis CCY0110]
MRRQILLIKTYKHKSKIKQRNENI